jgi:hypothetical protein
MGGRVSRAKRACVTETSTSVNLDKTLSGGVNVTKNYDQKCVKEYLSQPRK